MPRLVTYQCPDCQGTFDFLHHPSDEPPPDNCLCCNAYMGDDPPKAPVFKLNIGTAKGKSGDKLYRDMERASEARIDEAVELTGGDKSDFAALKMTNLKDNNRVGDISAVSATQAEKNLSYKVMGRDVAPNMQNPQAAAWAGETTSGPAALSTRSMINHMQTSGMGQASLAEKTARGNMGKY